LSSLRKQERKDIYFRGQDFQMNAIGFLGVWNLYLDGLKEIFGTNNGYCMKLLFMYVTRDRNIWISVRSHFILPLIM
jgi:hypothetical protein